MIKTYRLPKHKFSLPGTASSDDDDDDDIDDDDDDDR